MGDTHPPNPNTAFLPVSYYSILADRTLPRPTSTCHTPHTSAFLPLPASRLLRRRPAIPLSSTTSPIIQAHHQPTHPNETPTTDARSPPTRPPLTTPLTRRDALLALRAPFLVFAALTLPSSASAVETPSETVRRAYDAYAPRYDVLDGGSVARAVGFDEVRREVVGKATGSVVEVAVGTGLNLEWYKWENVSEYVGVDISEGMLMEAERRSRGEGKARFEVMNAEKMEFENERFDTVIDTFSLCVFTDPVKVLKEMARVCKKTGYILLAEHARSDFAPMAAYQDVTAGIVKVMSKGCVWNQDPQKLVREAGMNIVSVEKRLNGLVQIVVATPGAL